MKIFIGADHRGFELKTQILNWMYSLGHEVEDCGANELVLRDDYVDFAGIVGRKVAEELGNRGIVICGSGAGVDITANKINGIRSSIGFNVEQVKAARRDDNLNVLALASDFALFEDAKVLIETFLSTAYDPTDNHVRRLEKIRNLEINH
jgi:ribose 5-phosphate isomerase B